MSPAAFDFRVYYEDTDAGGVMYHASHLCFAERARTEWLRGLGIEQDVLRRESGIIFVVRRMKVEYLAPARLDDLLQVTSEIHHIGHTSLDLRQTIRRNSELLAELEVKIVAVGINGKPTRLPEAIVKLLS